MCAGSIPHKALCLLVPLYTLECASAAHAIVQCISHIIEVGVVGSAYYDECPHLSLEVIYIA